MDSELVFASYALRFSLTSLGFLAWTHLIHIVSKPRKLKRPDFLPGRPAPAGKKCRQSLQRFFPDRYSFPGSWPSRSRQV
jgi:hypothetical protein